MTTIADGRQTPPITTPTCPPRAHVQVCAMCGDTRSGKEVVRTAFCAIVRCPGRGLVRADPPLSVEEMARLHASERYFEHPYFDARRDLSRRTVRARYQRVVRQLLSHIPEPGGNLLDVGCDTGPLLAVARDDFGMRTYGVEVSVRAATAAKRSRGLDVIVGQLTEMGLPAETFHAITLVDVVEHVPNPRELVAEAVRLLRPGGVMYVATADHDALINTAGTLLYRLFGPRAWPLLHRLYIPEHAFYFDRRTLSRLMQEAGLEIRTHRSLEFPLDEFGHGSVLKAALFVMFLLQGVLHRRTLQEVVAIKPYSTSTDSCEHESRLAELPHG